MSEKNGKPSYRHEGDENIAEEHTEQAAMETCTSNTGAVGETLTKDEALPPPIVVGPSGDAHTCTMVKLTSEAESLTLAAGPAGDANTIVKLSTDDVSDVEIKTNVELNKDIHSSTPSTDTYPKRGNAIFVVNQKGTENSEFEYRQGANEDLTNLKTVFCDKFNFSWINTQHLMHYNLVLEKFDCNQSRIETSNFKFVKDEDVKCACLKCIIYSLDHTDCESFVFGISSHGGVSVNTARREKDTFFQLADGHRVFVAEILDMFNDDNCPTLKDKPKIFIFQCCRSDPGVEDPNDYGVEVPVAALPAPHSEAESSDSEDDQSADDESDPVTSGSTARGTSGEFDEEKCILDVSYSAPHNDQLVIFASTVGKRTLRNSVKGSWMIGRLKTEMDKHKLGEPVDFLKILTQVAGDMSRMESKGWKRDINNKLLKDDKGKKIVDEKKSGLKNAMCFSHRLTTYLVFKTSVAGNELANTVPPNVAIGNTIERPVLADQKADLDSTGNSELVATATSRVANTSKGSMLNQNQNAEVRTMCICGSELVETVLTDVPSTSKLPMPTYLNAELDSASDSDSRSDSDSIGDSDSIHVRDSDSIRDSQLGTNVPNTSELPMPTALNAELGSIADNTLASTAVSSVDSNSVVNMFERVKKKPKNRIIRLSD